MPTESRSPLLFVLYLKQYLLGANWFKLEPMVYHHQTHLIQFLHLKQLCHP